MRTCYACNEAPRYRLVAAHQPLWRRALRLPPRTWVACAEHHHGPLTGQHRLWRAAHD
jgi:hypothetical protein